jgi:hypothetical protein
MKSISKPLVRDNEQDQNTVLQISVNKIGLLQMLFLFILLLLTSPSSSFILLLARFVLDMPVEEKSPISSMSQAVSYSISRHSSLLRSSSFRVKKPSSSGSSNRSLPLNFNSNILPPSLLYPLLQMAKQRSGFHSKHRQILNSNFLFTNWFQPCFSVVCLTEHLTDLTTSLANIQMLTNILSNTADYLLLIITLLLVHQQHVSPI